MDDRAVDLRLDLEEGLREREMDRDCECECDLDEGREDRERFEAVDGAPEARRDIAGEGGAGRDDVSEDVDFGRAASEFDDEPALRMGLGLESREDIRWEADGGLELEFEVGGVFELCAFAWESRVGVIEFEFDSAFESVESDGDVVVASALGIGVGTAMGVAIGEAGEASSSAGSNDEDDGAVPASIFGLEIGFALSAA
jgi:hypothetical protein